MVRDSADDWLDDDSLDSDELDRETDELDNEATEDALLVITSLDDDSLLATDEFVSDDIELDDVEGVSGVMRGVLLPPHPTKTVAIHRLSARKKNFIKSPDAVRP